MEDIWAVDPGPTGVGKAVTSVNPEVAFEAANMGYMTASIWAARKGLDLDEEVDSVRMGDLRTISESLTASE